MSGDDTHTEDVYSKKEMVVHEGIVYTIGEFECPHCHTHHLIKCNPKGRTRKHWVE
jgi:hypothetical protein